MGTNVFVSLLMLVAGVLVSFVNAHSWAQCVDYMDENGRNWDESKCRAWPRDFVTKFSQNKQFGADVGMDHRPGETTACQTTLSAGSYSTEYPAPSYAPGQRVCMAWPPKNHVAAKCANPNIKDSGTKIYRSGVNPSSDPTLTEFMQNLVADLGTNTQAGDGVGYQNCPAFCTNNDKALCTGCFDVPSNLAEGKYIFLWDWAFNDPSDKYTTCMDVTISKSVKNVQPTKYAHVGPDAYAASSDSGTTVVSSGGTKPSSSSSASGSSGGSASGSSGSSTVPREPTTYSPGSIAAAVILTFLAVTAIFVGLMWAARTHPHSTVGGMLHRVIEPHANPRRETLLSAE